MKKISMTVLIMCSFLLSGCKKTDNLLIVEDSSTSKTEISSTTDPSETEMSSFKDVELSQSSDELWNEAKSQELNDFMGNWGQTMDQIYREYSPNNNVDLYGSELPDSVLGDGSYWQAVINEEPIAFEWSEDGRANSDYALVAVYSDADTQPYLEKHVYFFTIKSGIPVVLVTTQNQGNPNDYLYFRETDNQELKNGFIEVVNSNATSDNS